MSHNISSLSELRDIFNKRMTEFETQIPKTSTLTSSSSSLATEFSAFRAFITEALNSLQQQLEVLALNQDNMELRGRRKMLLLHGVAEKKEEDTAQVVAHVVKDHFQLGDFQVGCINRCHRMGRVTAPGKSRPILIKFVSQETRNKIWFEKTKLKGTGITLSEFLTKARHDVFMAARERFGVTSCWTRDGNVYVLGADGTKHRVIFLRDLDGIAPAPDPAAVKVASVVAEKPAPTKSKRTAAKK